VLYIIYIYIYMKEEGQHISLQTQIGKNLFEENIIEFEV
jgi:hypothetical protein